MSLSMLLVGRKNLDGLYERSVFYAFLTPIARKNKNKLQKSSYLQTN